jgi:hypothetical protein
MAENSEVREGGCHCGAVRFRVRLSDGLTQPRRCTCSYCRMRGAVALTAPLDGLEILQGEDNLTLYQFNTGTAKHYFCRTCGIYTHHQRRSNPNEFGINATSLDGVIRTPADQFAGMGFGHQWKPVWLRMRLRSLASSMQRSATTASRSARQSKCRLTTGSSTWTHMVSAG